jgi:hypothetical protein
MAGVLSHCDEGMGSPIEYNSESRPPIEVITCCIARDLPILRLAVAGLREHLTVGPINVVTARENFPLFQRALGQGITLLDEDNLIPGMTLVELRKLNLRGFPESAGWYFQQLLKLAYAFHGPANSHYLIWDADTILLRPMELFDESGRVWFTMADEFHAPYFETYVRLFGHDPRREFSFVSQHMVVSKPIMREMLSQIEAHCPGGKNWAWKIMENLSDRMVYRFSEYETYGHYVKNLHFDTAAFRRLEWTRDGALASGRPTPRCLRKLAEHWVYAAFESRQSTVSRAKSYWNRLRAGDGPLLPGFMRKY